MLEVNYVPKNWMKKGKKINSTFSKLQTSSTSQGQQEGVRAYRGHIRQMQAGGQHPCRPLPLVIPKGAVMGHIQCRGDPPTACLSQLLTNSNFPVLLVD